jgi:hypothetical protein
MLTERIGTVLARPLEGLVRLCAHVSPERGEVARPPTEGL